MKYYELYGQSRFLALKTVLAFPLPFHEAAQRIEFFEKGPFLISCLPPLSPFARLIGWLRKRLR